MMCSLIRSSPRSREEPTLPLINIVFLMLIFFLVAAQISRPLEANFDLVSLEDLAIVLPPDALLLTQDGRLVFRGKNATPQQVITALRTGEDTGIKALRLVPDRRSRASDLVRTADALRSAGAQTLYMIAERRGQ